jgi:(3,5-dihydroxyphenyl)acetyl-CoA 1,2-dioxygenase
VRLIESEVASWVAAAPAGAPGSLEADASATTTFLERGETLLADLPARPERDESEAASATEISSALHDARERFLVAHAERVYELLTDKMSTPLRLEELLDRAAERFPGLVPDAAVLAAERERPLADKNGAEIAHGQLLAHVLSSPRAGTHLLRAMLRPTAAALERLDDFRATGELDLDTVLVRRERGVGTLELRNPRHLNAEDDTTLAATETAVDLILLDPQIEVGVMRGGVVDHPRYAGRRIFGAGLNLTRLYRGQIPFLFYLVRDLGFVSKIYRGHGETEKVWIAGVETYAIGGACQLLHVMDHVIAERGARLYLPARKEGIIPGASPLRLPRSVGDRLARQAIMSGREFIAGTPEADLIGDEIVEGGEMDAALARRAELLTSSGLVNAAANRRAMREGQEPLDLFRTYMATYARDQAHCHFSPELVRNLEEHWNR